MDKKLAKSIGLQSRKARHALNLTQEDAAERIGVSTEFYARIERGNALPSVQTLAGIMSALGVSGDALIGDADLSEIEHTGRTTRSPGPVDTPEIRRTARRLRRASPGTLRIINLLLKEIARQEKDA